MPPPPEVMTKEITEAQTLELLRQRITYSCKIKDLAEEFGVSQVLAGKSPITGPMLQSIGVTKEVRYFHHQKGDPT